MHNPGEIFEHLNLMRERERVLKHKVLFELVEYKVESYVILLLAVLRIKMDLKSVKGSPDQRTSKGQGTKGQAPSKTSIVFLL